MKASDLDFTPWFTKSTVVGISSMGVRLQPLLHDMILGHYREGPYLCATYLGGSMKKQTSFIRS